MQKEQLSALMDGEALDKSLLLELTQQAELQQQWQRYHLVRDTLRGDIGEVIHLDISARVAEAVAKEPQAKVTQLIPEAQPEPTRWQRMPFFGKHSGWVSQLTQAGVAACVSLVVIVGVQHYNHANPVEAQSSESPAFNTLPMMGKASPVSLGVPNDMFQQESGSASAQQQRARVNAMWQDYELQRRLNNGDAQTTVTAATSNQHSDTERTQP